MLSSSAHEPFPKTFSGLRKSSQFPVVELCFKTTLCFKQHKQLDFNALHPTFQTMKNESHSQHGFFLAPLGFGGKNTNRNSRYGCVNWEGE
jgi:hypothetical protein